ncbi:MAG: gluconokinase [Streptosporangiaceae bacterium]|nr:gluconokinase [Streptosporangiaceae bacterium]
MVVIVAGVSGSGKTTVGAMLAGRLNWTFADADDFHPAANVAKMHAGIPLTDEDRWPWLRAIAAWIDERIAAGEPAVVTCSALKRAYRDVLVQGRPSVWVVFLSVDRETLRKRLATRHGHFFPQELLDSQLATAEPPGPDERAIVVTPADGPAAVVDQIVSWIGEAEAGPARHL